MKQFLFLITLFTAGGLGSIVEPFWAVLLYYTFAVLRPQYLWKWALPVGMAMVVICGVNHGR